MRPSTKKVLGVKRVAGRRNPGALKCKKRDPAKIWTLWHYSTVKTYRWLSHVSEGSIIGLHTLMTH